MGDSTVLRRFAVSVGRARRRAGSAELRQFVVLIVLRRASSAELRQYLVLSACWRASSAELRQFLVLIAFLRWVVTEKSLLPVALLVLTLVFCLSVNSFVFMGFLFINSGRCA